MKKSIGMTSVAFIEEARDRLNWLAFRSCSIWSLIEEADLTLISGLLTEEPESVALLKHVKSNEEKEGVFQDTVFLHNHMKKEHLRATLWTWFCSDIKLIQSEVTFQLGKVSYSTDNYYSEELLERYLIPITFIIFKNLKILLEGYLITLTFIIFQEFEDSLGKILSPTDIYYF